MTQGAQIEGSCLHHHCVRRFKLHLLLDWFWQVWSSFPPSSLAQTENPTQTIWLSPLARTNPNSTTTHWPFPQCTTHAVESPHFLSLSKTENGLSKICTRFEAVFSDVGLEATALLPCHISNSGKAKQGSPAKWRWKAQRNRNRGRGFRHRPGLAAAVTSTILAPRWAPDLSTSTLLWPPP